MDEVFLFTVEDGHAWDWTAQVAVKAASEKDAYQKLRAAHVRKKQIRTSHGPADVAAQNFFAESPRALFRRRDNEAGWEPIPDGASLNWRDIPFPGGLGQGPRGDDGYVWA